MRAIGVTTKKKISPITNGDTTFPNKIPNLNHSLFSGVRTNELIKPRIRKIIETDKDQILIFS